MTTGQPTFKGLEMLRQVAAEALANDAYRQQLLANPAAVLSKAGLTLPSGVQVVVHENTAAEIHFVLPTQQGQKLDPNETNVVLLSNMVHL
jgi:hypothetical protein